MKYVTFLLFAVVSLGLTLDAPAASVVPEIMPRPEGLRHYLISRPPASSAKLHPLVIVLHGHGSSAGQIMGQKGTAAPLSVWLKIANREDLLVVAPEGMRGKDGQRGWNDCRSDAESNPDSDDIGFISAIIDKEIRQDHADPKRVFIMGMSNGGMMTLRAASEIGDRLTGVAIVSGSMALNSECREGRTPLSVMIISGTQDPIVPYTGGRVSSGPKRGLVRSIDDTTLYWRQVDGLSEKAGISVQLPHLRPDDPTTATQTVWGTDPSGLQVELLRIDGGGHIEPSQTQRSRQAYTRIVGGQNGDVEAAEEAWAFFKTKHR